MKNINITSFLLFFSSIINCLFYSIAQPIGTCSNPRDLYVGPDCDNYSGNSSYLGGQNNLISTPSHLSFYEDYGADMSSGDNYTNPSGLDGSSTIGTSDALQRAYWCRFTATHTDVQFYNESNDDALDYVVYDGANVCNGVATEIASVTIMTNSSQLISNLTVGTTYYVMITGYNTTEASRAYLCVHRNNPGDPIYSPPGDNCSDAPNITHNYYYNVTNSNATADLSTASCANWADNNVWLRYNASFTGTAYLYLQDHDCADYQGMQVSIFEASSSCPTDASTCTIVGSGDTLDLSTSFSVVSGSTYYIQLTGYWGTASTFNFCISPTSSADCNVDFPYANLIPPSLLPIELYSFRPYFEEDKVKIDWRTLSEKNSDYFEIEKSIDGENYLLIDRIKAAGESQKEIQYSIYDEDPFFDGASYYRLVQYDLNGVFQKYQAVSLESPEKNKIIIFPNPTEGKINIEIPKKTGEIEILVFNSAGVNVYTYKEKNNCYFYTFDVSEYFDGLYTIRVNTQYETLSGKFTKSR